MPVTITTINDSDQITNSRTVINTNFTNAKNAVETLESTVDDLSTTVDGLAGGGPSLTFGITPLVVPAVSGLTWVNQGSAQAVEYEGHGFVLKAPAGAGDNIRMLTTALTANYEFVTGCVSTLFPVNYSGVGIGMRNSTTGTIVLFSIGNEGNLTVSRWTNLTSFSTTQATLTLHTNGKPIFLRVTDGTGSRVFSYSFDGREFLDCYSEANNAHVGSPGVGACDQIGIAATTNNGSAAPAHLSVFHYQLSGLPG